MAVKQFSFGNAMSLRLRILLLSAASLLILGAVFAAYAAAVNRDSRRMQRENISGNLMFESETVNKTIGILEQGAVDLALSGRSCLLARARLDDGFVSRIDRKSTRLNSSH